jgi:hypothetical protein
MKFDQIKDANGLQLGSMVAAMQEKCNEAGITGTFIFAGKAGTPNEGFHIVSQIDGPPEKALMLLALAGYGFSEQKTQEIMTVLETHDRS